VSFYRGICQGARCILGPFGIGSIDGAVAIATDDWIRYLSNRSDLSVVKIGHFS
jgi:hypothetical protein